MPRRERPAQTGRSEHWLRVAVNERTHEIDELVKGQFGWPSSERIEWRSPLKSDDYAEYYDGEFLTQLGIENLRVLLNQFWPGSGPRWDALARTDNGKIILVEAKAHVGEMISHTQIRCEKFERPLRELRPHLVRQTILTGKAHSTSTQTGWRISPFCVSLIAWMRTCCLYTLPMRRICRRQSDAALINGRVQSA